MRPTGDHKMVSAPIDSAQKCEPGDRRLTELGQEIARALTVRRCGASRSHGDFARLRVTGLQVQWEQAQMRYIPLILRGF